MFKLTASGLGKFKKYEFSHSASGTRFSLVPELGALILQVKMEGQKLLDSCETEDEISANPSFKNSLLLPFPNRLKNGKYSWNGKSYQFPLNNPDPPVNALHGFAFNYPTSVEKIELSDLSATILCKMEYRGEFEFYPFPFIAFFQYKIDLSGNFNVSIKIKNTGNETLPIGVGWHPYFRLGGALEDWELSIPHSAIVEVNEHQIPTGKKLDLSIDNLLKIKELDTGFKIKKTGQIVQAHLKNKNSKLTFWQETGDDKFNFLQVYVPPKRDSVAIEPMTCNIDVFNNHEGLITLEKEETWSGNFGFSFSKKS